MPPHPSLHGGEDVPYNSSEDSDFAPDAHDEVAEEDSDEADEPGGAISAARIDNDAKLGNGTHDDEFNNSGDEAIIRRGKRKRNKQKARPDPEEELNGGEGGLIKTRRQRAAEKEERNIRSSYGSVTVDVDVLWEQMLAGNPTQPTTLEIASATTDEAAGIKNPAEDVGGESTVQRQTQDSTDLIRIQRTYNFAGKVHVEEKLVPRESAEAKLFLSSQGGIAFESQDPIKRKTRKAFRSAFEPLTDPLPQRTDLNLGVAAVQQSGRDVQAKKMNTVEKSRLDWAGYVDKEGIKNDLELAGKSKDSYSAKESFLARSEARRDGDARQARMAGRS